MPHAFFRCASTVGAQAATSDTRFVCEYRCALARVENPEATRARVKSAVCALFCIHQDIEILLGIEVVKQLSVRWLRRFDWKVPGLLPPGTSRSKTRSRCKQARSADFTS